MLFGLQSHFFMCSIPYTWTNTICFLKIKHSRRWWCTHFIMSRELLRRNFQQELASDVVRQYCSKKLLTLKSCLSQLVPFMQLLGSVSMFSGSRDVDYENQTSKKKSVNSNSFGRLCNPPHSSYNYKHDNHAYERKTH